MEQLRDVFHQIFLSTLSLRRATLASARLKSDLYLFLSTLSLRRATQTKTLKVSALRISIHALLAESDRLCRMLYSCPGNFYPRSPCGERRSSHCDRGGKGEISIHALLAESDEQSREQGLHVPEFLSTLSLRRATFPLCFIVRSGGNFYPRSPCGERLEKAKAERIEIEISIHALLAESDTLTSSKVGTTLGFLSTLSLRRATVFPLGSAFQGLYFYPRSPCGERLGSGNIPNQQRSFLSTLSLRRATFMNSMFSSISSNFYPRSPCGERPERCMACQSKHSHISIHALLAESDDFRRKYYPSLDDFYPRSPCGERLLFTAPLHHIFIISIHALLAESDCSR